VRGTSAFALPKLETASLRPGSSGIDVETLQLMLKDAGLYTGPVDGIYGRKTAESVKKMQKYVGVDPDGIFGPKTLAAYNSIVNEAKGVQAMLETQADKAIALNGKIIGIDAGHQRLTDSRPEPITPGSERTKIRMTEGSSGVRTGTGEYKITLIIAQKLSKLLQEAGADVVMTRSGNDANLSNKERAELMNRKNVDIWIRLHCDASSSSEQNGARAVIPSYLSNPGIYHESKALGEAVLDSFCEETGARNNEMYQRSDQTGFNWSERPVITLEMGYLSNSGDDMKLNSNSYQNDCAQGITDGVIEYFVKGNK
jgi:N-acetylmuramoyl-L-alanine amidase